MFINFIDMLIQESPKRTLYRGLLSLSWHFYISLPKRTSHIVFVEMAETSSQVNPCSENAPDDERSILESRGMYIGMCELSIRPLLFCHISFKS